MDSSNIEDLTAAVGERYDIEGIFAEGGMGAVYTARNRSLGSRVAIKILPPEVATSPVRLARFKREAALAANLSHPHIVPVFEFDASHGLAYLVMPFVEGETLADLINRCGHLDYATVHEMIRQVAGALGFAHRRSVVHRDIKPANILLEQATGRWLLTDFGVAHVTDPGDTEITRSGVVVGTPAYMAPEQRWGGTVDGRSDLYSLAAVAYQALCGVKVDRLADDLSRGKEEIERAIRLSAPELSSARASTLAWPLAVPLEERPGSAELWLAALDQRQGKRRAGARWAGIAALAVVAFAAGWMVFHQRSRPVVSAMPTVAVLPFQIEVRGDTDTNDLATVLPQAFDWQLQYLPDHRVLGAEVRNEIAGRYGTTPAPPDTLLAAARRHGATIAVQGRVASSGSEITIRILVHDVVSGRLVADADSTGPPDSLDALVSGIVIKAFTERLVREFAGWSSSLPRGLDAINAYVKGDRDFRRGAYDSAVEHLDRVILLDSAFAPAHFKRMLSLMVGLRPTLYSTQLWSAFEAASEFSEGLDPVSKQLLAGYELLLRDGDIAGAEEALLDIVERYPRAPEAWYLLGYVQFNLRTLLGTSLAESRIAFNRAVERDPDFASALWHLALISVLEKDENAAREYLARFLAIDSTSLQAEIAHTYDSLLYRGMASFNRVIGTLEQRSTGTLEVLSLGAGELRPPPGVRPIAREALRAFWNKAGSRDERQMAFRMRMAYLLARGRFASADTLFTEAELMRVPRFELDRWIVLSAVTSVPDLAEETDQRAAVERLENAEDEVAEALWLAARWLMEHDSEEALPIIRKLSEIAADSDRSTPQARSLWMDMEARRYLAAGDTLRALATWEDAMRRHSVDQLMFGLTASLWPIRLDLAAVAYRSGQPETVLRIASTFDQMAAVVDQLAWPEILRIKIAAALATNNALLARSTAEELIGVLEEANGAGLALKEQAESLLAAVRR